MYRAKARMSSSDLLEDILVDDESIIWNNQLYTDEAVSWQSPVTGTIYGTLFNFEEQLDAMKNQFLEKPYITPPNRPILYIKPRNTINAHLQEIRIPADVSEVQLNATLGVVIGKTVTNVREEDAFHYIDGYTVVNDITVPHDDFYRPNIKNKVRDGFCPVGPWIIAQEQVSNPEESMIWTFKNEELVQVQHMNDLVRPIPKLLAAVTDFMTLFKGDMLLVGVPYQPPKATIGDTVRIEIDHVGRLENSLVADRGTVMKRARVACYGAIHEAVEKNGKLLLQDGRIVEPSDVVWLPPVEAGTILALGLNYADHANEISFKAPDEPLVFLKGPNTLVGHQGQTRRPAGVEMMHYECELAVIIGKTARHVKQSEAYDYISGYTVANDYAIRDYLENYYRPNLAVKNRDTLTPIGPYIVDKHVIEDPMNLSLKTYVNGKLTQEGSTKDMVFDIPFLMEYITSFMTLSENDIILTGTPKGTVNVSEGDEVISEIEGIGSLKNTIVGDDAFHR